VNAFRFTQLLSKFYSTISVKVTKVLCVMHILHKTVEFKLVCLGTEEEVYDKFL
jgi:hypothetical protein